MTTKERIVEEALTLFSIQGYKGTSVKNIADAVGIKDSSIYKHFKSKKEIIDAIVEQMRARMTQMSQDIGLPQGADENEEADAEVLAMSFYSPVFFLLSKYSQRPEHIEEALQILDKQVAEFYRLYKVE